MPKAGVQLPDLGIGKLQTGVADLVAKDFLPASDHPYIDNPVGWIKHVTREFPWSKQRQICRSVTHNRYTAVPSCHDSGKSFIASRLVAWWIDVHPPGQAFAVTTAPTSHQVDAILWREIGKAHRKGNLPGRTTLNSQWRLGPQHGEELVAYGRKPADYDPEAFQGIHAKYVLVVIDEANGVPKMLFDAVDTIVTNEHCRVLAIGNPDSNTSHFYNVCKKGSGWNTIRIDGFKTPNFTGEDVPEELLPLLLSPEWVEERRVRWGEGSPLWQSKVRGLFPTTSTDVLVNNEWWDAACRRTAEGWQNYPQQRGIDVARFGVDRTICYSYQGGRLRREWQRGDAATTETAEQIRKDFALNPDLGLIVDETGVGGGVVDILTAANIPVTGFVSGEMPTDDRFNNQRSQAYWHLRELFEFGAIDVDPADEELKDQLTTLTWKVDNRGKIVVEPKSDYMKRMGTSSPDAADGAMMSAWEPTFYDPKMMDHTASGVAISHDMLEVVW